MQGIAKKLKNSKVFVAKKLADRARQARSDELSLQQERNPTTVSEMIAQIRDLHNKVNSWSDAGEFTILNQGTLYFRESKERKKDEKGIIELRRFNHLTSRGEADC